MIYSGKAITVQASDDGIAELCFDLQDESVNKFNALTLNELRDATAAIAADKTLKGVIVTSGKPVFIVGADIMEFGALFGAPEDEIADKILATNVEIFNAFEDLPVPTVAAINGIALGGGFEMALVCDYRVMSDTAKIGLPETKLGIIPGYGGTTRLPRLIGADNAIEWIASGKEQRATEAMRCGAVDAVVEPELLRDAALALVQQCIDGKLDYEAKRREKQEPLKLNKIEATMVFETSMAFVAGMAGPHYPAPVTAIKVMKKAAEMSRDDALREEARGIAKMAGTLAAKNLIGLFLGDQLLAKSGKSLAKKARNVERAAVLGAGIMGGGIAYQSALKGTPIIMKDIAQAGIDLGLSEASKLLAKQVERGRMSAAEMAGVLNKIQPSLSYDGFDHVDVVIEAVVENPKVKHAVLTETESRIRDDAVLASNTSTISITDLAEPLKRPENFCGMHFFNPVHRMPLVEVIRGETQVRPLVAQPAHVLHDRVHEVLVFLQRVGVVEAQVGAPAELGGQAEIQADGLGMAEVQIAVGLRRKPETELFVGKAIAQVFLYDMLYEIQGFSLVAHWIGIERVKVEKCSSTIKLISTSIQIPSFHNRIDPADNNKFLRGAL